MEYSSIFDVAMETEKLEDLWGADAIYGETEIPICWVPILLDVFGW